MAAKVVSFEEERAKRIEIWKDGPEDRELQRRLGERMREAIQQKLVRDIANSMDDNFVLELYLWWHVSVFA